MKKKSILVLFLAIITIFALVFTFAACDKGASPAGTVPAVVNGNIDINMVYSYAVSAGYEGTLEEFIAALKGDSAYDIAVAHGFSGTETEWLASLVGAAGRNGENGVSPTIGENGNWWIASVDTGVSATGRDGNGIKNIQEVESDQIGKTKIQITFDNDTTTAFYVVNGVNGTNGAAGENGAVGATGNGIESVEKTNTEGLVDTYTITFTDGTTTTFTVLNGANGTNGLNGTNGAKGDQGEKGDDGKGIVSIAKTGNDGLVDTYTINYSDGSSTTFTVTNGADGEKGADGAKGADGEKGADGAKGADGVSIVSLSINDDGELVIVLSNDENINVGKVVGANGAKGDKGDTGATGPKGEKGDDGVSITDAKIVNNELVLTIGENDVNLGNVKGAKGENGNDGTSITGVRIDDDELIVTVGETDFNLGNVKGEKGDKGDTGEKGEKGDTGATGPKGDTGATGEKGETGDAGKGIQSIVKTSTDGLVDTYTITYTDNTSSTFTVTNGSNGQKGDQGEKGDKGDQGEKGDTGATGPKGDTGATGKGIVSIVKTATNELVDTYTITYSDDTTSTFTVTNGAQGAQGIQGETGAQGEQGEQGIQGEKGDQGVSIESVEIDANGHLLVTLSNSATPIDCGQIMDVHEHSYGEWIVLKDATCTENGLRSHVCSTCGIITGEVISALGHDYVDGICNRCHREQVFHITFMADDVIVEVREYTVSNYCESPAVPAKTGYSGVWEEFSFTPLRDFTVNVVYTANHYTLTINANGGVCDETPIDVAYGEQLALPIPTRTGYHFDGWYNNSTSYATGDVYQGTESITLTAAWTANTYTITLDPNGGTCESASVQATYGSALTLPTPSREGYVFVGWYDNTTLYNNGDTYLTDHAITLVASWEEAYDGTTITNASELASMSSSGNYRLANDIDFGGENWTILSTFAGTFDGEDHTISNINLVGDGLIGINNGTVRNLNISSATLSGESEKVAILVQENNGTIENCSVSGSFSAGRPETVYLGGVVAYNTGTIRNCSAEINNGGDDEFDFAKTTSTAYFGGIVGYTLGTQDDYAQVLNCHTSGSVKLTMKLHSTYMSSTHFYVGGIIGYARYTNAEKSYATLEINATLKKTGSGNGYPSSSGTYNEYVTLYVGGFVGGLYQSTISNSFANNNITTNCSSTSYYSCNGSTYKCENTAMLNQGGFIGVADTATVSNCYSNGVLNHTCKATAVTNGTAVVSSYVGGFIGKSPEITITNCFAANTHGTDSTSGTTTTNDSYNGFYSNISSINTTKCYRNSAFPNGISNSYSTAMALADMKTTNFIYSTLEWSTAVWSETDGDLPTLI